VDEANAAAAKRCHGGQGHRQREIQRHRGIRRRTALRQNLVCCRHGAGFIGDDRAEYKFPRIGQDSIQRLAETAVTARRKR